MKKLPSFYFYVDEFQSFANESYADILSEARKYHLSLTIAHQYIEQMTDEVRAAVFGNVGTTIVFRVGPFDAEVIEKMFFPTFTKEDIVNLGFAQVYMTLMVDGIGSKPFSAITLPPIAEQPVSFRDQIIEYTRKNYSEPRAAIEEAIRDWHARSFAEKYERPERPKVFGAEKKTVTLKPKLVKPMAKEFKPKKILPEEFEPEPVPVSLKDILPKTQKVQAPTKGPTPEKVSALRAALSEALKERKEEVRPEISVASPAEEKEPVSIEEMTRSAPPPSSAKEVPEDLLRKILQ
jgi:hypothetical protein